VGTAPAFEEEVVVAAAEVGPAVADVLELVVGVAAPSPW